MRIAIGGITHEANTFCSHITDMADFEARQVLYSADILIDGQVARTEQSGAISTLSNVEECEIVPTFLARALAGAPMEESVFRTLLQNLLAGIASASPVDGVVLVLHGAMMSQGTPDATGEILAQVRTLVGPNVPIVGTLDLHANVTQKMVDNATALIAYHTAPHVDMYETGQKAAEVLIAAVQGEAHPTTALVRLPMLLPPENSTHNYGPLKQVIDRALDLEAQGKIIHGGVFPVQPWMDTPDVAVSIVAITDADTTAAERYAQELAELFWSLRSEFVSELVPPAQAVQRVLHHEGGMVVLCDSADATTSGSTGDSTAILGALLDVSPFEGIALANIVDPTVVSQAIEAGIGATLSFTVGGSLAPDDFTPVTCEMYVKLISDGTFIFKGPGMRGIPHHMGCAVVLYHDNIHLVVMERGVSQWDPELYRSMGEEPRDARMVQVKSPMAFRAAYDGLYDDVIVIAAPGAASPQLSALNWQYLPRPMYPFDMDMCWPVQNEE